MKILVIGAGAVGGVISGILTRKGFQVDVVCNSETLANQLKNEGLILTVKKKTRRIKLNAYSSIESTPGDYNFILLATKANDMDAPAQLALTKMASAGLLVSLQDGFCEEKLARMIGSDRVIGASIGWGATQHEPGYVEMTSKGEAIIGKLDGSDDKRLDELQYFLNEVSPTEVVANIKEHIYSKLILNSCVNTLGIIGGQKIGHMLKSSNTRNLFINVIREAIDVANALNLQVPEFAGRLNYYHLIEGDSSTDQWLRHLRIMIFGIKFRNVKSSGLQSIERGELSEVDVLNGYIVIKARETGVPVPLNEQLVSMVHEIENGQRKIGIQNFEAIL